MKGTQQNGIDEKKIFLWVLIATSAAFLWVLLPFAAPLLWACILAVLFQPLNARLLRRFPDRRSLVALGTLMIAIVMVVLPVILILTSVVNQAADLFKAYEAGDTNIDRYVDKVTTSIPLIQHRLESWNVDVASLKEQLRDFASTVANFATKQSLAIGQNTLAFFLNTGLMLYVSYFLLRDGPHIVHWIKIAFPLEDERETKLFRKFSEVIRATVKGNMLVGAAQGTLGGIMFWFLDVQPAVLWAVMMALASLIPAIGAAIIWGPVVIYFFAAGDYTSAIILALFGGLVISMVDNLLRPILVGRDTKLPDYVVLLSTLGGISLAGIHGFVVGPLIAALFFTLWTMFVLEFNSEAAQEMCLDNDNQWQLPEATRADVSEEARQPAGADGR